MRRSIIALLAACLGLLMLAAAPAPAPLSYAGKTVLITGSTEGLGRSLALALAAQGARVIVHGRDAAGGQALVDEITRSGRGSAVFYAADFSSLQAVRDFAATIGKAYPKLDLLVNNAGLAVAEDQPRRLSADGNELQFQVNYLAGWMLANLLRPNLAAAAPSRVINVSSGSAAPIDFDDVMLARPGAAARGYGQSKLAQVTMTVALAPSFAKDGITMIALHPATLMDTALVRGLGITPESTVEQGRDHVMSLITAPSLQAGAFYVDGQVSEPSDPQPYDAAARAKLMALSAQLTGVAAR